MMNTDGLILGINPCIAGMNYHDPSVCLIDSDKIIFAIEEERLNRIRHSSGMFPTLAVEECKHIAEQLGRPISDIAVGFDPSLCRYRNLNSPSELPNRFDERTKMSLLIKRTSGIHDAKVSFYPHHKAHAASSANMIMAESTMCVVFDGTGELSAASIWEVKDNQIILVDSVEMPNSLGYFYAAATAYLGFRPWGEEGKLMALAPYGKYDNSIMHQLSQYFNLDTEVSYDVSSIIGPCLHDGFALDTEKAITTFEHIFQHPRRQTGSPILAWYKNFAFCIQDCVEKAVLFYIEKWRKKKNPTHICCAGGLFMNCKMNGFLRASLAPTNLYVQPVAGDAGTAIGAAILCAQEKTNKRTIIQLQELSLGLDYDEYQIQEALDDPHVRYYKSDNIPQECAQMLKDGKIVAWFQGRNELGCRALGHRSILAAPTPYSMSDNINKRIKHREEWRPFACSMMEEFAAKILVGYNSRNRPAYMIEAFPINTQWYACMEAVIHKADNTTRPQVIRNDEFNGLYYELLKSFYEMTECPMVLNTSLNDKGQPIIQTPKEAVDFLINHDIDYLIIGSFVAYKNN